MRDAGIVARDHREPVEQVAARVAREDRGLGNGLVVLAHDGHVDLAGLAQLEVDVAQPVALADLEVALQLAAVRGVAAEHAAHRHAADREHVFARAQRLDVVQTVAVGLRLDVHPAPHRAADERGARVQRDALGLGRVALGVEHLARDAAERHLERELEALLLGDLLLELDHVLLARAAAHALHLQRVAPGLVESHLESALRVDLRHLHLRDDVLALVDEADHRTCVGLARVRHAADDLHRIGRRRAEHDVRVLALAHLGGGHLHAAHEGGTLVGAGLAERLAREGHDLVVARLQVLELEAALAIGVVEVDVVGGELGHLHEHACERLALLVVDLAADRAAVAQREQDVLLLDAHREFERLRQAARVIGRAGDERNVSGLEPVESEAAVGIAVGLRLGGRAAERLLPGWTAAVRGDAGAAHGFAVRRHDAAADRARGHERDHELGRVARLRQAHALRVARRAVLGADPELPRAFAETSDLEAALGVVDRALLRILADCTEHALALVLHLELELRDGLLFRVDHAPAQQLALAQHEREIDGSGSHAVGARGELAVFLVGARLGALARGPARGAQRERTLAQALDREVSLGVGLGLAFRAFHRVEGAHAGHLREVEAEVDLCARGRLAIGVADRARDTLALAQDEHDSFEHAARGELYFLRLIGQESLGPGAQFERAGRDVSELESALRVRLRAAHALVVDAEPLALARGIDLGLGAGLAVGRAHDSAQRAARFELQLEHARLARAQLVDQLLGAGEVVGLDAGAIVGAGRHRAQLELAAGRRHGAARRPVGAHGHRATDHGVELDAQAVERREARALGQLHAAGQVRAGLGQQLRVRRLGEIDVARVLEEHEAALQLEVRALRTIRQRELEAAVRSGLALRQDAQPGLVRLALGGARLGRRLGLDEAHELAVARALRERVDDDRARILEPPGHADLSAQHVRAGRERARLGAALGGGLAGARIGALERHRLVRCRFLGRLRRAGRVRLRLRRARGEDPDARAERGEEQQDENDRQQEALHGGALERGRGDAGDCPIRASGAEAFAAA